MHVTSDAATDAKCEAFSSVSRSVCGSDAKTGTPTGGTRYKHITVLKFIALPIAHAVAMVCFCNDEIVCLINQRNVVRGVALVCLAL